MKKIISVLAFALLSATNFAYAADPRDELFIRVNTLLADKVQAGLMSMDTASSLLTILRKAVYENPYRNDSIRKADLETIKQAILEYERRTNSKLEESISTITAQFKGICKHNFNDCDSRGLVDLSMLINSEIMTESLFDPSETIQRPDTGYAIAYNSLNSDIDGKLIGNSQNYHLMLVATLSNGENYYLRVR